jgi:hypothetical protein
MWRRGLALLIAGALTACSFAIQGPPRRSATPSAPEPPACTTSSVLPALDVVGAIGWVLMVASVQSLKGLPSDDPEGDGDRANGTMIVFGGLAVLHLTAMVVGTRRMARCREIQASRRMTPLANLLEGRPRTSSETSGVRSRC